MIIDSAELESSAPRDYDICIVGAGAAGITLAKQFFDTPLKVALVESGGYDYELDTQNLYSGESVGFNALPLQYNRLRFLGGSTNHWNGNIWPLFPADLAPRPWLCPKGWPISYSAIEPYYAHACELVEMEGPPSWDPDELKDITQRLYSQPSLIDQPGLARVIWQHSPPTRFGSRYRDELAASQNVDIILHANLMQIDCNEDVTAVEGIQVKSLTGKPIGIRAKQFVLACGGIENARLLLLSDHQQKEGLGNSHDQVGRYFMDHPWSIMGKVALASSSDAENSQLRFNNAQGIVTTLTLSDELLAKHELPRVIAKLTPLERGKNSLRRIVRRHWRESKQDWNASESIAAGIKGLLGDSIELGRDLATNVGLIDSEYAHIIGVFETYPYANSRVTLSDQTDALGLRRSRLDWRFDPRQGEASARAWRLLGEQFSATGLGRIQFEAFESFNNPEQQRFNQSCHHSGTTRMSADPVDGVVDPNLKVHGINNLYVAGSSTFTAAGVANPTLTIVAMALRLADHLRDQHVS